MTPRNAGARPAAKLVTQAAYARQRGVTKNAVWAAVRDGRIRLIKGKVDPGQADRDWAANTDSSKQVRVAGQANGHARRPLAGTRAAAQTKREEIRARREEMLLEKDLGNLVDRDTFARVYEDRQARAVKALMALPARLGPLVAPESDVAECIRITRRELERVVRDIRDVADGKPPA